MGSIEHKPNQKSPPNPNSSTDSLGRFHGLFSNIFNLDQSQNTSSSAQDNITNLVIIKELIEFFGDQHRFPLIRLYQNNIVRINLLFRSLRSISKNQPLRNNELLFSKNLNNCYMMTIGNILNTSFPIHIDYSTFVIMVLRHLYYFNTNEFEPSRPLRLVASNNIMNDPVDNMTIGG